jgi:hypothetical protein
LAGLCAVILSGRSICDGLYWRIIWERGQCSSYLSAYEDGTECTETSVYKIQTPVNYPEESIQHLENGETLHSRGAILDCHLLAVLARY